MVFRWLIEDEPGFGASVEEWRAWCKSLDKPPAYDEGVIAAKATGDEMIRELEAMEAGTRPNTSQ